MSTLELAKERFLDLQRAQTDEDLAYAGAAFRDQLHTLIHSAEGKAWTAQQMDACRWALDDSLAAERAFKAGQIAASWRLLDEVRRNLDTLAAESPVIP